DLGHRNIAYLGNRGGRQSDADRLAGYTRALRDAGIAWRDELVVHATRPEDAAGYTSKLLASSHPPTGTFSYNDRYALEALHLLQERRIAVPREVSVAGFDDVFLASYSHPPLTTVRQPKQEMGKQAVGFLLDSLRRSPRSCILEGTLVIRESTGPAPRS